MKINYYVRPETGVSFHRFVQPMDYMLHEEGDTATLKWHGSDENEAGLECDILTYSLYLETDAILLKNLQDKGTKIVLDIDDDWDVPVSHPRYQFLTERRFQQRILDNIRMADVVTCPTIRLQEKIRQYNKNTVVIPNALPYGYEHYHDRDRVASDRARFIYVGGSSHYEDIKMLEGKFKRIASDPSIKDHSNFIMCGYRPHYMKRYLTNYDQEQQNENYKVIKVPGVWDKIASVFAQTKCELMLPNLPPQDYITHYNHGDVSLIPLKESVWNSYKSPLKLAEAATRNIPVICSRTAPYSDVDAPGVMWVDNPNDWLKHIKKCIKDKEYVKDMGLQLGEYCREHYDLVKWAEVRRQLYKSLM